ncbi:NUDIX hydrolase [Jonesia quinghaiensis]|uniref:NUDIX hydrolase n=1 Tax=Jonesia quinghaiensis TaxID=262806 RepID=UPI0004220547|nr:NUDIX domain-containing protein [Jonesia quinghaiensis]
MADQQPNITVVAALVLDHDENLLLVRKHDTTTFIQPGGKPDAGESVTQTAARELAEETGLELPPERFIETGTINTKAANEPGHSLTAHCVTVRLLPGEGTTISAAAEIAEILWATPQHAVTLSIAPLLRDHVLPGLLGEATP